MTRSSCDSYAYEYVFSYVLCGFGDTHDRLWGRQAEVFECVRGGDRVEVLGVFEWVYLDVELWR